MFRKQHVHIRIIWSYLKEFREKTFASSTFNPKPRSVGFWYEQWRQKHLGPREGKSACEFLMKRIKVYKKNGTKVIIEEIPVLAVVTKTPLMQRAHSLPLASKIVFMDTTSSCDSYNVFANTM